MLGAGNAPRARCPDCRADLGPLSGTPWCEGCGRTFRARNGVWNLLPFDLALAKTNEDHAHLDDALPTWRRLILHKRERIIDCETRWLPELLSDATRRVLEIGGGLCYASALAKARVPRAHVTASDVSPRYLRRHARRVGAIFGTPANAYAALDAERLPFADGQFDAVFSRMVLYRVPLPALVLQEIARVLAPGGRYLGVESAAPRLPLFPREVNAMRERSERLGIAERPFRLHDWQDVVTRTGLASATVALTPGRRVRAGWLRQMMNLGIALPVAIRITSPC